MASAYDVTAELKHLQNIPPTVNDEATALAALCCDGSATAATAGATANGHRAAATADPPAGLAAVGAH